MHLTHKSKPKKAYNSHAKQIFPLSEPALGCLYTTQALVSLLQANTSKAGEVSKRISQ